MPAINPKKEFDHQKKRQPPEASLNSGVILGSQYGTLADLKTSVIEGKPLPKPEKAIAKTRKITRLSIDLGDELINALNDLAKQEHTSVTQLVAWMIIPKIKELQATNCTELREYKVLARGIHHEWDLDLEKRKKE